ncbi:transposase domain-containing protein, partial [Escherichia coli]|nr:transposase domain-containing protein [Escherichia coli]
FTWGGRDGTVAWLVAGGWWLVAGGWIGTCRLNDVDPESYLRHGLES